MTNGKIYEGDVGVKFIVTTGIDLTDATKMQIKVTKGDLTAATWTGTISSTDPQAIEYTSIDNDLNVSGKYKMYAYVEKGSASKHSGTVFVVQVYDVFK
jgi:hypothetical protein